MIGLNLHAFKNTCFIVNNYIFLIILCHATVLVNHTLWHERLGHPYHAIVNKVMSAHGHSVKNDIILQVRGSFQLGKSHKFPFVHTHTRSSQPFCYSRY